MLGWCQEGKDNPRFTPFEVDMAQSFRVVNNKLPPLAITISLIDLMESLV
jgi:hypothetical protein